MSSGGSKKVTVGYKYYAGVHMALCHGPVDKLVRIRVGGKDAWVGNHSGGAIQIDQKDLFGGEKREGGISGQVDIEMGGPTQGQNSYLASKLGSDLLPAFRGLCCAVLRQCYMGLNPYLKDWGWLLQRIHTSTDGRLQWYPQTAMVGGELTVQMFNDYFQTMDSWEEVESGIFTYPKTSIFEYSVLEDVGSFFNRSVFALTGQGPVGSYTPATGYFEVCNTIVPPGQYKSIWISKEFQVPAGWHKVTVNVAHDDGARAWVNGVEVWESGGGANHSTFTFDAVGGESLRLTLQVVDNVDSQFNPVGNAKNICAGMGITVEYVTGGTYGGGVEGSYGDMNPVHIIRECLTDTNWGMGYSDEDIDESSFVAAADKLYAEKMGISILWAQQTSLEDFISDILRHIDATLYVDRSTGRFKIKLVRADYVESSLLVLNKSNISRVENYTGQTPSDLVNEVTVLYNSHEAGGQDSVTLQNIALIQQQGTIVPATVEYPGFTNSKIAARVCARDLKALSTPLKSCTIYANRKAASLNPGDCFVWDWKESDDSGNVIETSYVMRITDISYGDGIENAVRITCTQDVFDLPEIVYVEVPPTEWTSPSALPLAATPRLVAETPYYEIVRKLGDVEADAKLTSLPELGYLMVASGRAAAEINAELQIDSGAGYADGGTLDFCPCAKLDGGIGFLETTATLKDGVDLDDLVAGSLAQIGDEIVVIEAITDGVATIRRGCLDTVPALHADDAAVIVWDGYTASDEVEYVASDELDVKVLTVTGSGLLAMADAPVDSITMDQRALRPYPPANVKIGDAYYPALIVADDLVGIVATWVHRDRTQQTGGTVIGWTEGSIGPESGVTYSARLVRTDTEAELDFDTGISADTVTFAPTYRGEVRLEVWSVRSGLESMQTFEHTFDYLAVGPVYHDGTQVYHNSAEVYRELSSID